MALRVCMVGMELANEILRKEGYSSFYEKELCVANTWFEKKKNRKIIYSMGGNEIKIDLVLAGTIIRKHLKDVKAIPGELQHWLVVTDIDKRK